MRGMGGLQNDPQLRRSRFSGSAVQVMAMMVAVMTDPVMPHARKHRSGNNQKEEQDSNSLHGKNLARIGWTPWRCAVLRTKPVNSAARDYGE
jgi:hypothetical protein